MADRSALDSRRQLGGIRQANQGIFEIRARNQVPGVNEQGQLAKCVRVVTTVEYLLKESLAMRGMRKIDTVALESAFRGDGGRR